MARGNSVTKKTKRQLVAAGKIAGKSSEQIATEAGCSERHVKRLAAEPETKIVVRDLLSKHQAKLKRLVEKSLTSIERSLDATPNSTKHDHRTQLAGAAELRAWASLLKGDVKTLAESGDLGGLPQVTWEEFQLIYRRRTDGSNPAE